MNEAGMPRARPWIPLGIGAGVALILAIGGLMVWRAESKTNKVALSSGPKPVTVVEAKASTYRASRTYVGTLEPWVEAKVGPQLVSAYVDTVVVRPGAVVKRGDVLATLDCRNTSASSQAIAQMARSIESRQKAMASEAARTQSLLDGGFVSPMEVENKLAQSESEQAQLLATQAKLLGSSLEISDCVLRSPFDGEVATRTGDPGAFLHPGTSILTVVDRSNIRVVADAPEVDFDVVGPGRVVKVHVLATHKDLNATISRRAPSADPATRTVHFEIDIPDPTRELPVGTTADLVIDVGEPEAASEVPLFAATVRGSKATLFVVEGDVAKKRVVAIKGEREGLLYVEPSLVPGTKVVSEGRELLNDNDKVAAAVAGQPSPPGSASAAAGTPP